VFPHWLPPSIILAYAGIVILLAATGAFAYTAERREAACKVLRLLLPWGVIEIILTRNSAPPVT
jgi:uncharacterized membrane protein SpoIIM required for sporulation